MNFSMNFNYNNYLQSQLYEVIIKYTQKNKQYEALSLEQNNIIDLLLQEGNKSIVLSYEKEQLTPLDITLFSALCEKYPTFKVRFNNISEEELQLLHTNKIRFFLTTVCRDGEQYQALCNLGVSDIYISFPVAAALQNIGVFLKQSSKSSGRPQLRIIANKVQTIQGLPDYKGFFVRPQDIYLYEPYIDIVQLYCPQTDAPAPILRAYQIEKSWYGDLSQLIYNLNTKIDNRYLANKWGEARIKCNKRCCLGSPCQLCQILIAAASNGDTQA